MVVLFKWDKLHLYSLFYCWQNHSSSLLSSEQNLHNSQPTCVWASLRGRLVHVGTLLPQDWELPVRGCTKLYPGSVGNSRKKGKARGLGTYDRCNSIRGATKNGSRDILSGDSMFLDCGAGWLAACPRHSHSSTSSLLPEVLVPLCQLVTLQLVRDCRNWNSLRLLTCKWNSRSL